MCGGSVTPTLLYLVVFACFLLILCGFFLKKIRFNFCIFLLTRVFFDNL